MDPGHGVRAHRFAIVIAHYPAVGVRHLVTLLDLGDRDDAFHVARQGREDVPVIAADSVAAEIGIDLETREALMNHSGRGVNVKHYVQTERFDHLRECAERIETALWERIKGARRARGRARHLSSSPRRPRLTSVAG